VTTYVALLRAVNVAGVKVDMRELRELVTALGHGNVRTYVQSGNVLFDSGWRSPAKLRDGIETVIRGELGLDVTTIVRRATDLRAIVQTNPFVDSEPDPTKLHVTFLAEPARAPISMADAPAGIPDRFVATPNEIFVHCPGGYGRTKLTNAWFERRSGVAATTRNWNTVTKLVELAGA